MVRVATVICLAILAGCTTPPPKGGNASQTLPAPVVQHLTQPDAPEGPSRQSYASTVTEHRVDGTVIVTRTEAETELGGSQDWVAAIKAQASAGKLKGLLFALLLTVGAIVGYSKGWPILASVLGLGAVMAIMTAWWAALIAMAGAVLVYTAYQSGRIAV